MSGEILHDFEFDPRVSWQKITASVKETLADELCTTERKIILVSPDGEPLTAWTKHQKKHRGLGPQCYNQLLAASFT